MAEAEYYSAGGTAARVTVYFSESRGKRRDKRQLARLLAEFVKANLQRANPVANFGQRELPDGFSTMSIASGTGRWYCGESGAARLSDIREVLTCAIREKDRLVPTYRENLGTGAQVWLLLYTTADVARGMPIPHGVEEWRFNFGFDRVFWFAGMERRFVEIYGAKSAEPAEA
jgi:hypothetical protein